jgi:hypothetical protein
MRMRVSRVGFYLLCTPMSPVILVGYLEWVASCLPQDARVCPRRRRDRCLPGSPSTTSGHGRMRQRIG